MELSLTAVTTNRLLGKAFTRLAGPMSALRECANDIDSTDIGFGILQVAFIDAPETHVQAQRTPKDSRILQIAVGLPTSLSYRPPDDAALLGAMGDQVLKAIAISGIPQEVRGVLEQRVREWKNTIYPLLGRQPIH